MPQAIDTTNQASLARVVESAPDVSLLVNNAGVRASFNPLTSSSANIARERVEDIFPDEMSRGAFATWRKDPQSARAPLAGFAD